ncbi:MAG: hypothetical protein ACI4PF_05220 [Christensenellales bacterium]
MEKTTKKKKSKSLKRRIGLIAVGGLSLVLTVCLSVGATLAWFAGSTWASNDLYMGGPVYVEMAGRGASGSTAGDGSATAKWVGGDGKLDIVASARTTGTAPTGVQSDGSNKTGYDTTDVLLPGQKLLIYSQARVFSTAYYDNLSDGSYNSQNSGANTTNTTGGAATYTNSSGVKKTTTTSVLRAKFSINIEFDPTVGFNNFTDPTYANGYPVQSSDYTGDGETTNVKWYEALGATTILGVKGSYTGRRDAVANPDTTTDSHSGAGKAKTWVDGDTEDERWDIKTGASKSIYKWKYVSEDTYNAASADAKMGAPFDGKYNTLGTASAKNGGSGNGYYGIWVLDGDSNNTESDAFYKARCNAYIQSYKEHYEDEYNRMLILSIGNQLTSLEDALNSSFKNLVNQSSDNILAGMVKGFTATDNGEITYVTGGTSTAATWLYVDPTIGQDTNASDSSTNVGGWWYLCESDATNTVLSGKNEVKTIVDNVVKSDGTTDAGVTTIDGTTGNTKYNWANNVNGVKNIPSESATKNILRADSDLLDNAGADYTSLTADTVANNDTKILNAKLFEIVPSATNGVVDEIGSGNGTYKVVSVSFPFVNGNFELPGKELTNIFANAKITFQITFQALQAFFPFTPSIDGCAAGSALAGTGKALNINNAIPIYNEAFDWLSYLTD